MAYDWRPTATRAATTDPAVVAAHVPTGDMRVATAVEEFVEAADEGRARNRSGRRYMPSAVRDLRGILRLHVAAQLGDIPLRDVRPHHVQAMIDRLADDGLSVSRIRSVVSAVRALFNYAVDRGYLELSPAGGVHVPREEPRPRGPTQPTTATWTWRDDLGEAWHDAQERSAWRRPWRGADARPGRERRDDHEPIAFLPERILSFVLRGVVILFILLALASIAESF
jgi:hypothetical protein